MSLRADTCRSCSGKADPSAPFLGKITVAEWAGSLEPAPRTPVVGKDAHAFRLLSSVIRDTYRVDEDGLPVLSGGEGVTVVSLPASRVSSVR